MNVRTLALRLACLSQEDQRWILSQLPAEHKEQFQRLRDEVVALGLNCDPTVLSQLSAESEKQGKSSGGEQVPNIDCDSTQALPPFWKSLLDGEIENAAFDHPERLPPAMRASLYRLAENLVDQRN